MKRNLKIFTFTKKAKSKNSIPRELLQRQLAPRAARVAPPCSFPKNYKLSISV